MSTAEFDPNELDPGIRRTVVWLRSNGFVTTDSGDGVTKLKKGGYEEWEVLPYPHVFMVVSPAKMAYEADKLLKLLKKKGVVLEQLTVASPEGEMEIEATYSPVDRVALLLLRGVNDEVIKYAERADAP